MEAPTLSREEMRAQEVLGEVRQALMDVTRGNYLAQSPITLETSFEADLQLESVEFAMLSERLMQRYPELDFGDWIVEMHVRDLMQLRVGALVEFIARCLSWVSTGSTCRCPAASAASAPSCRCTG